MYLELKDKSGKVYRSFINDKQKPVIIINGTEYEVSGLIPSQESSDALTASQIAELDTDPVIEEMIKQSKHEIKRGLTFSSKQMIDMIKNGEL
ncbi:hypothetical protein [Paenibacillus sp. URB8-2]|uniref:hypothetical protein n=1 Tax=Paenibacillus sp. URB8-2 TaxID=2741301 RepID=UPI0015B86CCF|nr:hypothetical protein [Paenibacillus sp. URB8-2]BCG58260.1 hypothetical protein PUR_16850 [Paenibacillus sp. URB8-2]